jgi:hypothetical protein
MPQVGLEVALAEALVELGGGVGTEELEALVEDDEALEEREVDDDETVEDEAGGGGVVIPPNAKVPTYAL